MAWQDSLAWVLAQDPRWVVVIFSAAAGLWAFWRLLIFVEAFINRPRAAKKPDEPRIEARLFEFGLAGLHHIVSNDGRMAVAIDPAHESVVLAFADRAFAQRTPFTNVRSVNVLVDDKIVEQKEAIKAGPVDLCIVTGDLTDPIFTLRLAGKGKLRERELTRVRSDAFAWRGLLRKVASRAPGSRLPMYLRELHTAGVLNEQEYRSLLDRAARI